MAKNKVARKAPKKAKAMYEELAAKAGPPKGWSPGKKQEAPEVKRLYRSEGRMIAGVCGGIAEYLNTDPTIVRLIWALFTVITGFAPGLVLYLGAWLIIPKRA